jgi:hypothetical protein
MIILLIHIGAILVLIASLVAIRRAQRFRRTHEATLCEELERTRATCEDLQRKLRQQHESVRSIVKELQSQ